MDRSYLLIRTERGMGLEVGEDLKKFEGVVHEVELFEEELTVLAEVVTDNPERLQAFIDEQVDPMPGIISITKRRAA